MARGPQGQLVRARRQADGEPALAIGLRQHPAVGVEHAGEREGGAGPPRLDAAAQHALRLGGSGFLSPRQRWNQRADDERWSKGRHGTAHPSAAEPGVTDDSVLPIIAFTFT